MKYPKNVTITWFSPNGNSYKAIVPFMMKDEVIEIARAHHGYHFNINDIAYIDHFNQYGGIVTQFVSQLRGA